MRPVAFVHVCVLLQVRRGPPLCSAYQGPCVRTPTRDLGADRGTSAHLRAPFQTSHSCSQQRRRTKSAARALLQLAGAHNQQLQALAGGAEDWRVLWVGGRVEQNRPEQAKAGGIMDSEGAYTVCGWASAVAG